MRRCVALALLVLAPFACGRTPPDEPDAGPVDAADETEANDSEEIRSGGHLVYVPAYSHIYHHRDDAFLLTTTLSIRNTDLRDSLTVTSVRYYDTGGTLVGRHLREPRTLGPLGSMEVVIEERDVRGGSGANFIVEWRSDGPVNPPVIETVMISTSWGQGISFTSRGVPIENPTE